MSTVFSFGAARCIDCKAPVAIVRRTVEVPCSDCPNCTGETTVRCTAPPHTHAIPDCLYVVVDAEGERHLCAK